MSQLILGFGNKARHGKDSCAEAIIDYYQRQHEAASKHGLIKHRAVKVQRLAFADALYKEVNEFLAITQSFDYSFQELFRMGVREVRGGEICVDKIPDWVTPDKPLIDPRAPLGKFPKLLQWWGTEFRRAQNPNYWVEAWKKAIDPKADVVIVTDVRFVNEAEAIKAASGVTIKVSRLNLDGTPFVDPTRDANHRSEIELDDYNFDYRITVKTGDLILLESWAITLVNHLKALQGK